VARSDLLPAGAPDDGGSALSEFLRRTTIYEDAGAVMPRDLVSFGLLGSLVVIATGVLALILPSPEAIRDGGFFLVLGDQAAGLVELLRGLAVPAIVCGIALLLLDVHLMTTPTGEQWRSAVVAQAAAGGVGGALGTLFLALLIFNLAIWIALVCLALAVLGVALAALGGGS
jgi:hypothetical protein